MNNGYGGRLVKKKNYLDHEIQVKFLDQYYEKKTYWQWFIDIVQEEFDYDDVASWNEFESRWISLSQVFTYLIKILEIGNYHINISEAMLADLFHIAKYYQGETDNKSVEQDICTRFGKTLYWVIWTTSVEKQENQLETICDFDLFRLTNIWQIRSMKSLLLYSEDLISFGKGIDLRNIDSRIVCLEKNIYKEFVSKNISFLDSVFEKYREVDYFSYTGVRFEVSSWQERLLVTFISMPITKKNDNFSIRMMFGNEPDHAEAKKQIENVISYYDDPRVVFILETVLFFGFNEEPSINTKQEYADIWLVGQTSKKTHERCSNIGFYGVSELISCGMLPSVIDNKHFCDAFKHLHEIKDVNELKLLCEKGWPISKTQKKLLREYFENTYMLLDKVNNPKLFVDYLTNDSVRTSINNEYFLKTRDIFFSFLPDESIVRMLSIYFYEYMSFLLDVKRRNQRVSKREINYTIILIQKIWEERYYEIYLKSLHRFSSSTEISETEYKNYNKEILINPLPLARGCLDLEEKTMCEMMENVSYNPMMYLVTRFFVSKVFPSRDEGILNTGHEVDECIFEFINNIRQEKEYRLINNLDSEKYLIAFYENFKIKCQYSVSMFSEEKMVYEEICKKTEVRLLPYNGEKMLAHVTQLFPILEKRIREMSSIFGVSPFSEEKNKFMKYKDPSNLLISIIKKTYKETGGFEGIYDLVFIYFVMYNGHSFNIRNDCIHGRGYDSDAELQFAFKATLLCIYMIDYRIMLISEQFQ